MPESAYASSRSSHECIVSGKLLGPGEPCVVVLCEREDQPGLLERVVISVESWDEGSRHPDPDRVVGSWRTRLPEAGEKRASLLDASTSIELLEQLGESDDPQRLAFRYVLALLLVRARRLEFVGSGDSTIVVREPYPASKRDAGEPEPEPIEIAEPEFAAEEIEQVAAQLETVLDMGDG